LAATLFPDKDERAAFVEAVLEGSSRESSIIVLEDRPEIRTFPRMGRQAWQPEWVHRIADGFRPAKHPLYEKGAYYSMDFSSVFSASGMLAIATPPRRILDLCSSPGGKAIFAWKLFQPEILVCNESIRKREATLIANLERCHIERSMVWSADPAVWGRKYPDHFDLVIVDAPCSGQSLLAKGGSAPGCFAPDMVDLNVGRQRRITGHVVHCVRPGGHLLYITCTYTVKENEKVVAWLLTEYPELEVVPISHLSAFRSTFGEGYRLYPNSGLGAGAYVCLLRKKGEPPEEWPSIDDFRGHWKYGHVREPRAPKRRPEDHSDEETADVQDATAS
jgi:16S rRNA C967 or C1407 C5-methylase (RsmB/RsmF family)